MFARSARRFSSRVAKAQVVAQVNGQRALIAGFGIAASLTSAAAFSNKQVQCAEIVAPKSNDPAAKKYLRTIVVAVDGTESSAYAFEWAMKNFIRPGDHLVLVNARVIPVQTLNGVPIAEADRRRMDAKALDEAKRNAEQFIDYCKTHRIDCTVRFELGDPRTVISRVARKTGANAVVMGSRALGTVSRFFLGSVSDYAVTHCSCPVLVVKQPPVIKQHPHSSTVVEETYKFAPDSIMMVDSFEGGKTSSYEHRVSIDECVGAADSPMGANSEYKFSRAKHPVTMEEISQIAPMDSPLGAESTDSLDNSSFAKPGSIDPSSVSKYADSPMQD